MELNLVELKNEVNAQIGDRETFETLVQVTFKGLTPQLAKRAFLEGRMRGWKLESFLKKDVYAVPFSNGYSLVTSIDYSRKIGQKSGVVGKSEPKYVDNADGKCVTCSVTIEKMTDGHLGEFTATVYFEEYNTGKQQWASKPRTMIAKVAEMHALRMACPEELSQAYVEEEYQREITHEEVVDITDYSEDEAGIRAVKSLDELKAAWLKLTAAAKKTLKPVQEEMKAILDTEVKETTHENV